MSISWHHLKMTMMVSSLYCRRKQVSVACRVWHRNWFDSPMPPISDSACRAQASVRWHRSRSPMNEIAELRREVQDIKERTADQTLEEQFLKRCTIVSGKDIEWDTLHLRNWKLSRLLKDHSDQPRWYLINQVCHVNPFFVGMICTAAWGTRAARQTLWLLATWIVSTETSNDVYKSTKKFCIGKIGLFAFGGAWPDRQSSAILIKVARAFRDKITNCAK